MINDGPPPPLLGVASIRLTRTHLPAHAILGEDVVLECLYDMEGDALYSVKWYRNGKEFYRHIPSDSPPTAVFRQPGLVVDVSQSQAMRNLSLNLYLSGTSLHRDKNCPQQSPAQLRGKLSL